MLLTHVCHKCDREWEDNSVPTETELCNLCKPSFPEFIAFKKIPRLSREIIITEKIDGTNGVIYIDENNNIFAGSRTRWLWGSIQDEIHNDNYGFAKWVKENKEELLKLGPGYHYGEWMGKKIQRGYGLEEKRFYLFNVNRWVDYSRITQENVAGREFCPKCCYVVPILYRGNFDTDIVGSYIETLYLNGSVAVPGFKPVEGIVVYHTASGQLFKKTIESDEKGKERGKNDKQM